MYILVEHGCRQDEGVGEDAVVREVQVVVVGVEEGQQRG